MLGLRGCCAMYRFGVDKVALDQCACLRCWPKNKVFFKCFCIPTHHQINVHNLHQESSHVYRQLPNPFICWIIVVKIGKFTERDSRTAVSNGMRTSGCVSVRPYRLWVHAYIKTTFETAVSARVSFVTIHDTISIVSTSVLFRAFQSSAEEALKKEFT